MPRLFLCDFKFFFFGLQRVQSDEFVRPLAPLTPFLLSLIPLLVLTKYRNSKYPLEPSLWLIPQAHAQTFLLIDVFFFLSRPLQDRKAQTLKELEKKLHEKEKLLLVREQALASSSDPSTGLTGSTKPNWPPCYPVIFYSNLDVPQRHRKLCQLGFTYMHCESINTK
jgi:hypothetical protein